METTIVYWDYIGGYMGIMEKKMETTNSVMTGPMTGPSHIRPTTSPKPLMHSSTMQISYSADCKGKL